MRTDRRTLFDVPAQVWVWLFVAVALIRAPFLFYFGYSIDAYSNASGVPDFGFLAGQGRHGSYLLFVVLQELGLYGPVPQYVSVLFSIPFLCAAAVLLWSVVFRPSQRGLPIIAIGAIVFLAHPYNAEILTFRDAAPVYALSTFLGVGGYYVGVVRGKPVASILLMAFALSIYQVFINILAVVWLLGLMLSLVDAKRLDDVLRADLRRSALRGALLIVAALLSYLVVIKLVNWVFHVPPTPRATFISVADVPVRWQEVTRVLGQFIAGDLVASARFASVAMVVFWVSAFAICLWDGRRRARFLVVPAGFVLTCLASIGVILVGRDFWPMPRVLVAFALLPAFGTMCVLLWTSGPRLRNVAYGLLSLLLLSYTAIGARVAADQVRVNRRDMLMAGALVARLPLAPGQHVAVVGGPDATLGLSTQRGDMNLSAFWAAWSKTTALSEFYGYPIVGASEEEYAKGVAYCGTVSTWPAMDSAKILDDGLAVVCLGRVQE